jgi:hypothetical protein
MVALAASAACELDGPSLNNPIVGGDATRSSAIATAQGLMVNVRNISTALVVNFGIWGRELYNMPAEEPRPIFDNLIGPRDPNSFGSGAAFNYGTLVEVRELLRTVDGLENMTDAEKEGIRGWAKTVAGIAYAQTAMVYPEFGAPVRPPEEPTGALEPIANGEELFAEAIRYFDEGYQHLQSAGGAFAFTLTEGYAGFETPATLMRANRALKARTLKYRGDWQGALTALGESFIDSDADLNMGIWSNYFATDNAFNPFFAPRTQYVHPRILADAQLKANGEKDDRAVQKTVAAAPETVQGITGTEKNNIYRADVAPFPLITNEELILIRAEARLATGDAAGALEDVNTIRTRAGGLDPVAGLTGDALLTEILYNKLYSLFYRGGWTYWDARQYDRLDQLPRALPSHVVFDRVNWGSNECIQRGMTDGPCGPVDGF